MNFVWGLIVAMVGALFIRWGHTESDFGLYRLLAARSRILWGDRVHGFYQIAGALMILAGVAIAVMG